MSYPPRLLHGDANDFERELLGSALGDEPNPALESKTFGALGLAAGTVMSTPSAAAATAGWTGKSWLVLSGVVMAIGGAGWLARSFVTGPAEQHHPSFPTAPAPERRPLPQRPVEETPPPGATADTQGPSLPPAAESPAPSASASSRSPQLASKPTLLSIEEERELVDRARLALRSGDARLALEHLASHGRRFPRGAFAPEVTVLRIEALSASGRPTEAARLGQSFLARNPTSLYTDRILRAIGPRQSP